MNSLYLVSDFIFSLRVACPVQPKKYRSIFFLHIYTFLEYRYFSICTFSVNRHHYGDVDLQFYMIKLQKEFLGHWNFSGNEYSYNIYDNGINQSYTMNVLGNYIKCNFREFDYIISVHVIRYMYHIYLVYNFPTFI